MNIFNLLISAIIQIMLFLTLPFIWWLTRDKNKISFIKYLGVKKPIVKNKRNYIITFYLPYLFYLFYHL